MTFDEAQRLAEYVRDACIDAAQRGYEYAGMSGLCHEGAMEASISAIRMLDVRTLLRELEVRTGSESES